MERQVLDRVMGVTDITHTDLNDMPGWVHSYNDYLRWCHQNYKSDMPPLPTPSYDGYVGEVATVIDKGRWIVSCQACDSNYMINKGENHFTCASCQYTPGRFGSFPWRRGGPTPPWMRVIWPENIREIEDEILRQPGRCERAPYRDWLPSWSMQDLRERTTLAWARVDNDPNSTGLSISSTRLWAVGEVATAANFIRYINNPINNLAGRLNPPIQLEDSLEVIAGPNGNRYILLPSGSTGQRPTLPKIGMVRYNTSTGLAEICTSVNPITWSNLGGGMSTTTTTVSGVAIDETVTHGQNITGWQDTYKRVVLGHDLGRRPRGYQLSLIIKAINTNTGNEYSVGDEILIPPHNYLNNTNWYKTNLSSPENTTAVLQIIAGSAFNVQVLDRNDTTPDANNLRYLGTTEADMRIVLWG